MKIKSVNMFVLLSALMVSMLSNAASRLDVSQVKFETNYGDFVVELYEKKAPKTVGNFLMYVDDGFYNGTVFHRVIKDFMIQGGGLTESLNSKTTRDPIKNESDNGLKNGKGFISMARTPDVNSATSQFFINTVNNSFLNYNKGEHGYAVFGKVISGYDVIEMIENKPTKNDDVPIDLVVIKNAFRL